MFRFIIPIILISLSIATFFMFTNPIYQEVSTLRTEAASYNEALDNSKELAKERDTLTARYNAIDPQNIQKLEKLLPDNVDNIRLILEIEKVAMPFGMFLKDVKYDATKLEDDDGNIQGGETGEEIIRQDYGIWELEFTTQGTYNNFLSFMKALEQNLRIVDVASVIFSSDTGGTGFNPNLQEVYTYQIKIKTYWLKN